MVDLLHFHLSISGCLLPRWLVIGSATSLDRLPPATSKWRRADHVRIIFLSSPGTRSTAQVRRAMAFALCTCRACEHITLLSMTLYNCKADNTNFSQGQFSWVAENVRRLKMQIQHSNTIASNAVGSSQECSPVPRSLPLPSCGATCQSQSYLGSVR